MDRNLLQEYADFAVKVGVNVQKGQTLIVQAPVEGADFARLCAAAGYEAGAARVLVRYKDEKLARLDMEKAEESELCDNKPWLLRSYLDYAEAPGGVCILHVVAEDPELYKGLDAGKVNRVALARQAALRPWQAYTHSNRVQWCIVAIPSPAWARKVFPSASGRGYRNPVAAHLHRLPGAARPQRGGRLAGARGGYGGPAGQAQ